MASRRTPAQIAASKRNLEKARERRRQIAKGNARYAADQAKKAKRRKRTMDIASGKTKVPKSAYDWDMKKNRKVR